MPFDAGAQHGCDVEIVMEMATRVWQEAARDLGVDVVAPYSLVDPNRTDSVDCIAYVHNFGSPSGTVVFGRHSPSREGRVLAIQLGLHWSEIDEDAYATYDRELFIATFNDWGWFGAAHDAPDWYTGAAWTQ